MTSYPDTDDFDGFCVVCLEQYALAEVENALEEIHPIDAHLTAHARCCLTDGPCQKGGADHAPIPGWMMRDLASAGLL